MGMMTLEICRGRSGSCEDSPTQPLGLCGSSLHVLWVSAMDLDTRCYRQDLLRGKPGASAAMSTIYVFLPPTLLPDFKCFLPVFLTGRLWCAKGCVCVLILPCGSLRLQLCEWISLISFEKLLVISLQILLLIPFLSGIPITCMLDFFLKELLLSCSWLKELAVDGWLI